MDERNQAGVAPEPVNGIERRHHHGREARQAERERRVEEREAERRHRLEQRQRRRDEADLGRQQRWESRMRNVVTCRLDDQTLGALDALVEAGVRSTRSEAASWLIKVGLETNQDLLREVSGTVTEIRRLRGVAMEKAQRLTAPETPEAPEPPPAAAPPPGPPAW